MYNLDGKKQGANLQQEPHAPLPIERIGNIQVGLSCWEVCSYGGIELGNLLNFGFEKGARNRNKLMLWCFDIGGRRCWL